MATFIPLNIELKNEIGTFEPQNSLFWISIQIAFKIAIL